MTIGSRYNPGSVPDYLGMASSTKVPSRGQQLMNTYDQGIKSGERVAALDRRDAARSEFASAWESGDQRQIERVMGMFPEYAKDIQNMIGIRDEQHRKDVGSAMMQVNTLASMGDAQGIRDYVRQNTKAFDPAMIKRFDNLAAGLESPKEEVRAAAKQQIDGATKGFIRATLTSNEMMDYIQKEARMAQDYELGKERNADYRERSRSYGGRLRGGLEKLSVRQQRARELSDFYANPTRELANLIISGGTVDQRKSAEFASRMKKATDKMNSIIAKGGISKGKLGEITRRLKDGTLASMALNPSEQLYVNAAMDIIRAQLRKESGASVSQNEWDTAFSHYLPTGADSEALMAEKQSLLTDLTNSAIASSGGLYDAHDYLERQARNSTPSGDNPPAEQSANDNAPPANRTPINVGSKRNPYTGESIDPSVGDVVDGYRFKGGDPGNPDNWEKV